MHLHGDDRLPWNDSFQTVADLRRHLDEGGTIVEGKLDFPVGTRREALDSLSIAQLDRMRDLRGLSFRHQTISGDAWASIGVLPLKVLVFSECNLEWSDKLELPELHLQALYLVNCTTLTDGQLADLLERFGADLEVLRICCRPITSAGTRSLPNLKRLRELDLFGTLCDEQTLSVLEDMPSLEYVQLLQSHGMSSDEINAFRSARPDVEVVSDILDSQPQRPEEPTADGIGPV